MYPTLVPGEVVLVDKTVARVSADAIYLLRVFGGIMVNRAQLHADGLHLLSDNPAYERRIIRHDELENGVEILGRVIWGGRRY
jgi:phage repressor protein C with HTH and peptisase S24 domain